MNTVLQVAHGDGYASELINDRFQIIESWLYNDKYFIYDHSKGDNLQDSSGSTMLFSNKNVCMDYINNVTSGKPQQKPVVKPHLGKKIKKTSRGESALSYLKELIVTTDMMDNDIALKVKERFPHSNYGYSMVKYNRKKIGG